MRPHHDGPGAAEATGLRHWCMGVGDSSRVDRASEQR